MKMACIMFHKDTKIYGIIKTVTNRECQFSCGEKLIICSFVWSNPFGDAVQYASTNRM